MDWQANWIWLKGERKQHDIYAHARKTFEIKGDVPEADLHVTANNIYRLFVNGTFVGRGPDRADPHFPYFDTYDVAERLRPGKNVIALDVYCITSEEERGRSWCLYGGDPGVLLQMDLREGAEDKSICTDATWRMIESPAWRTGHARITRFMGFVEHCDANAAKQIEGYREADFDDAAWETPELMGQPPRGPVGDPLPREIPFLERRIRRPNSVGSIRHGDNASPNETYLLGFDPEQPHTVCTPAEGIPTSVKLDFGRTIGGMLQLHLEGCCGGRVEVYYGENTDQVLCEIIELPREGDLRFESMDWRGARNVVLRFYDVPEPVTLRAANFVELEYPYAHAGAFEASDPMLGRIWRACRTTAQVGTKDHPQDCVHREQALWVGDVYVHVRTAAVCFGDMTPFDKAFRQAVRNVNEHGILAVPGPCAVGYVYDGESLGWSEQPMTVPMSIARMYEYTGDPELARFSAKAVARMMAHFARYEDARGLIHVDKPGLQKLVVFTGWGGMLKHTGVPTNVNAEYVMSLRDAATIMSLAGDDATAREYEAKAKRVAAAVTEHFFSPRDHLFIDGERDGAPLTAFSPTVNAHAVRAGLLPNGEEGAWAHAVENHPHMGELTSPFDASALLEAFFSLGCDDAARRLIDVCWARFVEKGEVCVPERWVRGHDSMLLYGYKGTSSRCHPYGTGPAYCFHKYLLGIRPRTPGYSKVLIQPHHMGLHHACGRMATPLGEIEVFWRRDSTEWYLEAVIPEGVNATIALPRFDWGAGRMTCDGETVWHDRGWERFRAERHREPHTDLVSRPSARISSPGRHVVVMTAT